MKRFLFFVCAAFVTFQSFSFTYEYEGQTLNYSITNSTKKTCSVTSNTSNQSIVGVLTIPSVVTFQDKEYTVTSIDSTAFERCNDLSSIIIPNTVTTIGGKAFSSCKNLTTVTIGNSVRKIGSYAFDACSNLTTIELPESLVTIGCGAFRNCSNLSSIQIPNSVTTISDSAFEGCSSFTTITIPNSVTDIGFRAFANCSNVKEVTIEDGESILNFGNVVFNGVEMTELYLGRNLAYYTNDGKKPPFYNKPSLTKLKIGNSVTDIGWGAFYGCSALTTVNFPKSVTKINQNAFRDCVGLTSIIIPNSVTSIGGSAFSGCSGIKDVIIEDGETNLDFSAYVFSDVDITNLHIGRNFTYSGSLASNGPFANKTFLTGITISEFVTNIIKYAFRDCSGIESIECRAVTPPSVLSNSFDDSTYTSAWLYVPAEAVEDYMQHSIWNKFNISQLEILIEEIELNSSINEDNDNNTFTLIATIYPSNATNQKLDWYSSNEDVATVDANGNVTLHKNGECSITAKATDGSGVEATWNINNLANINIITDNISESISIYDINGILLNNISNEKEFNQLNKGIYILRKGNQTKKLYNK